MPLVVLEGPDGAGKSTLAQRLLKGTGHPTLLVKRSGPPGDIESLVFQSRWIKKQSESGLNIIADRHPIISEGIYAPTVRRVSCEYRLEDVVPALRDADFLLIYCRTDYQTQRDGSRVERQMDGVHQYYDQLLAEYDRWMASLSIGGPQYYHYNWRLDPAAKQVIEFVRVYWERAERAR